MAVSRGVDGVVVLELVREITVGRGVEVVSQDSLAATRDGVSASASTDCGLRPW
jgi:hypothetical protein